MIFIHCFLWTRNIPYVKNIEEDDEKKEEIYPKTIRTRASSRLRKTNRSFNSIIVSIINHLKQAVFIP